MTFEDLGWRGEPGGAVPGLGPGERLGRVAVEHRSGYLVASPSGEFWAEVAGRLRHEVETGRADDRPAVGDWVVVRGGGVEGVSGGRGVIRAVLPRRGVFVRKEAGRASAPQVVAANVDVAFLVASVGGDLNPRRLERYLTLALEGGVAPVVVLTKADLAADPGALAGALDVALASAAGAPVHAVSGRTGEGLDALIPYFEGSRTVALLGSSGVGKSTLINRLLGREAQRVREVRGDGKGRHTTTQRELIARPGGGLLVDTPGMRELALWGGDDGVGAAFPEVEDLAAGCRFGDCSHRTEPGCAVLAALADGSLPADRLDAYRKLRGELLHLDAKTDRRVASERKRREKEIHRAMYRRLDDKRR